MTSPLKPDTDATKLRTQLSMAQKMPKRRSRTCWPYMLPWWTRETDFSTPTPETSTDQHDVSENPAANANHAEASAGLPLVKRDGLDDWHE